MNQPRQRPQKPRTARPAPQAATPIPPNPSKPAQRALVLSPLLVPEAIGPDDLGTEWRIVAKQRFVIRGGVVSLEWQPVRGLVQRDWARLSTVTGPDVPDGYVLYAKETGRDGR